MIILLSCRRFRPFLDRAGKPSRLAVSLVALILVPSLCNLAPAWADQPAQPDARECSPAAELQLRDLQDAAARFNSLLVLPDWETTPAQVDANVEAAIADANRQLEIIAHLDPKGVTFGNTIRALDDINAKLLCTVHRVQVLEQAHPDPKMRNAGLDAVQKLDEFAVGIDYRKDVYRSIKAYLDTNPRLESQDARLVEFVVRGYKRAGLTLPDEKQQEVEALRKELAGIQAHFLVNANNATARLKFTRDELEGVSDDFCKQTKTAENEYTVDANVPPQYIYAMTNCVKEETRKRLCIAHDTRAKEKNLPLAIRAVEIRAQLAELLGYRSWTDYQEEVKMAKTGKNALDFEEKLKTALEPKYQAEISELKKAKASVAGSTSPDLKLWDWYFASALLQKQKYNIDTEALRVYFPFDRVLDGMFKIYEHIFQIEIRPVDAPPGYQSDLKVYAVLDQQTRQPLGLFYLDLFPRPGKYNHFANFALINGGLLPDGKYQRPVVDLICNFPPPSSDRPSLASQQDVVTIFHEFGHAMHAILTTVNYVAFSGFNVPGDFVEAPSQMLEYFAWDKKVLDSFAGDYREPAKKIPADVLTKLKEADLATKACAYRRQLSFGLLDLLIHEPLTSAQKADLNAFANSILNDVFFPSDPSTAMLASFGHLFDGYDAGYYGYAWADAIAADMASVFQSAPDGFLDATVGRRLRDEIYAVGDSRDINVSVEKFLGREHSTGPFLKKLGISAN
ncbi:MAG TPA: M3 family metallopeptidase [Chthoniobacterales bacterium]|nr:M3 family metallopeptidase [Chthoniobacterales bacterium]